MSSWADDEFALELARTNLAERYPGEAVEIVETFDIAHSGWECDDKGALITRDGAPEIVIVDRIGGDPRPDIEQVREQLAEYRRLIVETEGALARYQELTSEAYDPAALEVLRDLKPARRPDEHVVVPPQRVPGESDDDYERRRQLVENGGRIAIDVTDLSQAELDAIADSSIPADLQWNSDEEPPKDWTDRLQLIADEHPHDNLEIVGGSELLLKRQIARAIIYATEAAGAWDQPAFLRSIGMPEDWIVRAIEHVDTVPLSEFVDVYEAAAKAAGWQSLPAIVAEVTQRQRFREWP